MESRRIVEASNRREDSGAEKTQKKEPLLTLENPENGFCIRCKAVLPANPTQPYCKRCYASWRRFENETYEEKHCHMCGSEYAATLSKPVCRACYKKYKDVFEFVV